MEQDNEVKGSGNWLQFGDFGYDPRTARRNNTDPVVKIWESSYATFWNNPIYYADPSGLDVHEDCETGQIYHVPDGYVGKDEGENGKDWGFINAGELLDNVNVTAKAPQSYNVYFPEFGGNILQKGDQYYKSHIGNNGEDPYDRYQRLLDKGIFPENINTLGFYSGPDKGNLEDANWIIDIPLGGLSGLINKGSTRAIASSRPLLTTTVTEEVVIITEQVAVQYTKSSLRLGQQMHKAYKAGLADKISTFKEFVLPSGKRIDFLDIENGIIYELKPNNPRAILQGQKQLQIYMQELQSMPKYKGIQWRTVLDTY